jgi:predicted CXXCH cytochrome family protein
MFSYRPGEPLGDYMLHFKLAANAGRGESFEVVNAASRFLDSACYVRSSGKLTCTTCHNPHDVLRGEAARVRYAQVCRTCHDSPVHRQPASGDCVSCHMPKRRTDDAVHVIMTDHLISRRPVLGDLLAAKQESHESGDSSYLGPVVPAYPARLSSSDALYLAVAQVREAANLTEGIATLQRALARWSPKTPEFHHELGEAHRAAGKPREAAAAYEQALARSPGFVPSVRGLGLAYAAAGDAKRATERLEEAVSIDPGSVEALNALGSTYQERGRIAESIATLQRAVAANAEAPEPFLNLGAALAASGNIAAAAAALNEAIRLRPDFAAAHNNLAIVLERQGQGALARRHFEQAVRLSPNYADARSNLGLHFARLGDWPQALEHLQHAVRLAPSPGAFTNLGTVLAKMGDLTAALEQYRRALELDSEFARARLNLARTLIETHRQSEAIAHLRVLLRSHAPEVRTAAGELLKLAERP